MRLASSTAQPGDRVDLFEFNDDFIAATACGMSDEDALEMFAESIRAGADVLEQRLVRIAGRNVASQVRFVNGAFEIPLTQDQFDAEFGGEGEPPQANVRRAIIAATTQGSREMSRVLSGD